MRPGCGRWLPWRRADAPRTLAAGDRLAVDEIALQRPVADPRPGARRRRPTAGPASTTSRSSCSARSGERRFLLMGDVEEGIDPSLLADGLPHVDLLKVAHHGSKTATTQAFVDADPTDGRGRLGRGRQPVRPPGEADARPAGGSGRARLPDGSRRIGRGRRSRRARMTVRAEGGRPAAVAPARHASWPRGRPSRRPSCARSPSPGCCRQPSASTAAGPCRPDAGPQPDRRVPSADDRAWAGGGRLPPAVPGSPALVRPARAGRGRGRRLARGADRGRGIPVDRALVEAAALLHDVDKALPRRRSGARPPPWRRLGRLADPGTATLSSRGRSRNHPVTRLLDGGRATAAGRRSRPARSGSCLCRQARRPSGSSRWTRASPGGDGDYPRAGWSTGR